MTAYEIAYDMLGPEKLGDYLAICGINGFVHIEEDLFLCAIPFYSSKLIDTASKYKLDTQDTWFVYMAAGNMKKAFDVIPELDFVAFERNDSKLRIYDFNRMRKYYGRK